ncbi:hypothetical protein GCM10008027_40930 [Pseudoalteromonas gelatinilytica]|uniref:Uncharacterized protein n=1 Tax=Pseudoalteromonas gelatinilytica TaxID=1703256 RepID=A0ABQ1U799_9GAMM|nr:hypothetical protein GCM10008027_40930 [Pseudoalteromonas profundi]
MAIKIMYVRMLIASTMYQVIVLSSLLALINIIDELVNTKMFEYTITKNIFRNSMSSVKKASMLPKFSTMSE